MNTPLRASLLLLLSLFLCCSTPMLAQSSAEILDKKVARDDIEAIEDMGVLLQEGLVEIDAYVQAAILITTNEETGEKFQGTYREVIEKGTELAAEAGNKRKIVEGSALIIPESTELIKDDGRIATFKLHYKVKNQLKVPLYGLDLGIDTYLVDGTEGYGSTGVEEANSFVEAPIAPGETRSGLYVIVHLDHDEEPIPDSIYGMDAVINNLKTKDVSFWSLPIYDCRTAEGWLMWDKGY